METRTKVLCFSVKEYLKGIFFSCSLNREPSFSFCAGQDKGGSSFCFKSLLLSGYPGIHCFSLFVCLLLFGLNSNPIALILGSQLST